MRWSATVLGQRLAKSDFCALCVLGVHFFGQLYGKGTLHTAANCKTIHSSTAFQVLVTNGHNILTTLL